MVIDHHVGYFVLAILYFLLVFHADPELWVHLVYLTMAGTYLFMTWADVEEEKKQTKLR